METESIKERIEKTKVKLIPLFEITDEELKKFQTPAIIRELGENDYPGHGRLWAGYDSLRNLFYWPLNDDSKSTLLSFRETEFVHHTASYLHHQINPSLRKHALALELKEKVEGYDELRGLVGEYPNLILGNYTLLDHSYCGLRKTFHLFVDHGPLFLPRLARMSLDEVLAEGIIKINQDD